MGNLFTYSVGFQHVSILLAELVMVVAGVVVVLVPTLTTLGAVWSKLGNCLRASPVLDPPFQLRTHTNTSMTTRVCSGSG